MLTMKSSTMRNGLIAALMATNPVVGAVLFTRTVPAAQADARALIQKAQGSIAVLTGEDKTGQPIQPSIGFLIGSNLIATIHRQLPEGSRLSAKLAGQAPTFISYRDSYRQATIMTTAGPYQHGDALPIGNSDKVAEKDHVYLFSGADPQSEVSDAVVRRIRTINDRRFFELSVPPDGKIDGGPVFNTRGEVIGILTRHPEAPNLTLALPAAYLTVLLNARTAGPSGEAKSQGSEVKPTEGAGSGSGSVASGGGGAGSGTGGGQGRPSVGPGLPSTGPGAGTGTVGSTPSSTSTATRAKVLNSPRPRYTEIARLNQTQGVVVLRILVGEDGAVKRVNLTKGLPDGLDERAVEAAFALKFQPATRDGVPITSWMSIMVEFNLR